MSFLPIVHRELLIASRARSTFRNRSLTVGVVSAVAATILTLGYFGSNLSQAGRGLFETLTFLAALYCLLEGVRKTADCLSEEKREGTLGFLFLTNLRGYDVVLGKLASNSIHSFYGLLSIMPVLALPILMGGVTQGEFWRTSLALISMLFFSLSCGIWVSSWSRDEQSSMSRTFALIGVMVITPMLIPYVWAPAFSPYQAFHVVEESVYNSHSSEFFCSLGIAQLYSWGFLALASVTLPKSWRQEKEVLRGSWFSKFEKFTALGGRRIAGNERTKMLDQNPIWWLCARDGAYKKSGNLFAWSALAIGLTGISGTIIAGALDPSGLKGSNSAPPFVMLGFLVLNFLFKLRLAQLACRFTAEARRLNSFELLFTTPLNQKTIMSGMEINNEGYYTKGYLILAIECVSCFTCICLRAEGRESSTFVLILVGFVHLFIFLFDMAALTVTGAWLGLTCKKESIALTRTVFYVLILPLFSIFLFCFGILTYFLTPVICFFQFGGKLSTHLRSVVENNYEYKPVKKNKTPAPITT